MSIECPKCTKDLVPSEARAPVVKYGFFRRVSDSRILQKFRCNGCRHQFSRPNPCRWQKKRQKNFPLYQLLTAGVSQRRAARILNLDRKTIVRKFLFLGAQALEELKETNLARPKASILVFDDLETFEHTKCKPLSVTLAVDEKRRVLGFRVAKMVATGRLAKISVRKYGRRADERAAMRKLLFADLQKIVKPSALIKSDQNPYYLQTVKKYFPEANYKTFKGQRGSTTGQGELKKVRFDPLFCLNHSCAMLRANINRLFRKTWCTTKLQARLNLHLAIYSVYHNKHLMNGS